MTTTTHVSSHVSILELRCKDDNWGYTLVSHNNVPARSFNDPSGNDELSARRIAHDWQQHGFIQKTDGNHDELIAIGMQNWIIPDFIEDRGGLAGFVAEQVYTELKNHDYDWGVIKSPFQVVDPTVGTWIKNSREDFLAEIRRYTIKEREGFFGALFLDPYQYRTDYEPSESQLEEVEKELTKLLTHGYHLGKRIYKNQDHARRVYFAIVDKLTPYVLNVTENSPKTLKMYVNIQKEEVEIVEA